MNKIKFGDEYDVVPRDGHWTTAVRRQGHRCTGPHLAISHQDQ